MSAEDWNNGYRAGRDAAKAMMREDKSSDAVRNTGHADWCNLGKALHRRKKDG